MDDFEAFVFSIYSEVAKLLGEESGLPLEVLLNVAPNPLLSTIDV